MTDEERTRALAEVRRTWLAYAADVQDLDHAWQRCCKSVLTTDAPESSLYSSARNSHFGGTP